MVKPIFSWAYSVVTKWCRDNYKLMWNLKRCNLYCIILIHISYIKPYYYGPGQAMRFPGSWGSQISRQQAHEGGKFVNPTHQPPFQNLLQSHCYRSWAFISWKNNTIWQAIMMWRTYLYLNVHRNINTQILWQLN
jgi:hypothetical protein